MTVSAIAIWVGLIVWLYLISDDKPTDPSEWM